MGGCALHVASHACQGIFVSAGPLQKHILYVESTSYEATRCSASTLEWNCESEHSTTMRYTISTMVHRVTGKAMSKLPKGGLSCAISRPAKSKETAPTTRLEGLP
eukprot:2300656-Amphidinium_carterae.1